MRRRSLRTTRTSAYNRRCPAAAARCGACNDHAAEVLVLLGTAGTAAADDQTDDVHDRANACPPPVWAASFYGIADVLLQANVGRGECRDPKAATRDSGSTPVLMAAQEGHTERLAAGIGAGEGGL
jgi:hypothetical protein